MRSRDHDPGQPQPGGDDGPPSGFDELVPSLLVALAGSRPNERERTLRAWGGTWGWQQARQLGDVFAREFGLALGQVRLGAALEAWRERFEASRLGSFEVDFAFASAGALLVRHQLGSSPLPHGLDPGAWLEGAHAAFFGELAGRPLAARNVRRARGAAGRFDLLVGSETRLLALLRPGASAGGWLHLWLDDADPEATPEPVASARRR
jgi:hypothetical protein